MLQEKVFRSITRRPYFLKLNDVENSFQPENKRQVALVTGCSAQFVSFSDAA